MSAASMDDVTSPRELLVYDLVEEETVRQPYDDGKEPTIEALYAVYGSIKRLSHLNRRELPDKYTWCLGC